MKIKNHEVKKLNEWLEILGIENVNLEIKGSNSNQYYKMTKNILPNIENNFIDIRKAGGYQLQHEELENELNNRYIIRGLDINRIDLESFEWALN